MKIWLINNKPFILLYVRTDLFNGELFINGTAGGVLKIYVYKLRGFMGYPMISVILD